MQLYHCKVKQYITQPILPIFLIFLPPILKYVLILSIPHLQYKSGRTLLSIIIMNPNIYTHTDFYVKIRDIPIIGQFQNKVVIIAMGI